MGQLQHTSNKTISDDLYFEIARCAVPGYTPFLIFSENDSVGASPATLWSEGGIYEYIPTPAQMTVLSESSDDTSPSGVGALSILIAGLDSTGEWQQETVVLSGTTPKTTLTYSAINLAKVLTVGSSGKATGPIHVGTGTITANKPANVYSQIKNNGDVHNKAMQSPFTIPVGYSGLVKGLLINTGKGKEALLGFHVQPPNLAFTSVGEVFAFEESLFVPFSLPPVLPELSRIEMRARDVSAGAGITVFGGYTLILEKITADYFIDPVTWEKTDIWPGVHL